MDLWIRSQDREMLRRVDCIYLNVREYGCTIDNGVNVLGRYRTQERGLEVLNEMQQALQQGFVIDKTIEEMTTVGAIIHNNSDAIVFEMPKD